MKRFEKQIEASKRIRPSHSDCIIFEDGSVALFDMNAYQLQQTADDFKKKCYNVSAQIVIFPPKRSGLWKINITINPIGSSNDELEYENFPTGICYCNSQ